MEEFLNNFKSYSRADQRWLSAVFEAVQQQFSPLLDSDGFSVARLAQSVVEKVQRAVGSDCADLPVSYRIVSVSELIRDQRTACCSSLCWSSAHYRDQAKKAEQTLPNYKALPRDNLLLIGFLCDGRADGKSEGEWRVRDAGGSVPCMMLKSSCLWLGRLMLFPTWNYIPQNAPGAAGYLELVDPPVCVTLEAMTFDPGGALTEVMSVRHAAELLAHSCEDQVCVCVGGQVCVVGPLLLIRGKRFFCLVLSDGGSSVALIIRELKHQYWRQCVCVGQSVWISSLRVCSLGALEGRRVLTDSCQSRLHPHTPLQESSEEQDTEDDTHTPADTTHTLADATRTPADDTRLASDPAVRVKPSTIISFKGTVTKILNAEAGLYELDGQVGLCLAYQPTQKWGGGLRPGAEIQLHNVHFTYQASAFAPRAVLWACLRSSVQITAFSRLCSELQVTEPHGALQRLLLERNLGPSQYLWLCYCQKAIAERLSPRWVRPDRVCVVAGRLLDVVCDAEQKTKKKRNIYTEMIQEPHHCPISMYCVRWPSAALWSVQQLCVWMQREVWSSLSLPALLSASAPHMTALELNSALRWSSVELRLEEASPDPLLLLGVLELQAESATLQLRDHTHKLHCLCVCRDHSPNISTAWQGCLVCVRRCTLVMERFMKTNFPSWKHLDQPSYITLKHCRVYLQLCMDDLIIISPSSSMSHQMAESKLTHGHTHRSCGESSKRLRSADAGVCERADSSAVCVSLLFRLENKHGVTLQNVSADTHTRQLGFKCRAVCVGGVQRWSHDPKNCRIQERERDGGGQTVELHFRGSCVRWFPVLHPGCVYRLIALNTEDVGVLEAKGVSARGGVTQLSSPSLLLQPQWRVHTLTEEPADAQAAAPALMSVSEVLHSSSAPEVVSFHGIISQRITLQEDNEAQPKIKSVSPTADTQEDLRVRLTVQDAECPGLMVHVYLDLSCGLYTLGLITGAALQVHHVQRKVSRACNVYCRSLPISYVSVTGLRPAAAAPPPPMMLLGSWASVGSQQCLVAQVKGHVVCVLSLRLQWICSLCGSIFTQTTCGRTHPPCDSTSAVFQAEAKVVLEDGTGEAHVWFSSESVCGLLMLNAVQWEGLQRLVRVKGHVKVYTRGRTMTCDDSPDDSIVQYLSCLCSSVSVCRQIHVTCRRRAQKTGKSQLRKVHRGQTEFICKFPPALQLQCQHIHTR
ncbi:CST complex subunit CTC1 isoform X1 [Danio rerio]|uniref:CST complex subunit CTC1 isoform X1 n=1 Tax=Danio rerio TaxID=7955 RepID=A0AC58IKW5_DANRE